MKINTLKEFHNSQLNTCPRIEAFCSKKNQFWAKTFTYQNTKKGNIIPSFFISKGLTKGYPKEIVLTQENLRTNAFDAAIYFKGSIENILDNIQKIKPCPNLAFSKLFKKIYEKTSCAEINLKKLKKYFLSINLTKNTQPDNKTNYETTK